MVLGSLPFQLDFWKASHFLTHIQTPWLSPQPSAVQLLLPSSRVYSDQCLKWLLAVKSSVTSQSSLHWQYLTLLTVLRFLKASHSFNLCLVLYLFSFFLGFLFLPSLECLHSAGFWAVLTSVSLPLLYLHSSPGELYSHWMCPLWSLLVTSNFYLKCRSLSGALHPCFTICSHFPLIQALLPRNCWSPVIPIRGGR